MILTSLMNGENEIINRKEIIDNYEYVATYSMGNIGITKIIDKEEGKKKDNNCSDSNKNNITNNNNDVEKLVQEVKDSSSKLNNVINKMDKI